jgi:hypothetical protein
MAGELPFQSEDLVLEVWVIFLPIARKIPAGENFLHLLPFFVSEKVNTWSWHNLLP